MNEVEHLQVDWIDNVAPNDDFCHNESDFLHATQSSMNEVLIHHQRNINIWLTTEELEGKEVVEGKGFDTIV